MASWGPETMQTHSTILCYLVFEGTSWPWEQMKLWLASVFFPFWKQSSPRVSGLKWEIRNLNIHLDHPWDAGNLCRSSLVVHPSPEVSSTSWDPRWESRIWVRLWASHWKKLIPVFSLSHHNSPQRLLSQTKRRKLQLKHKGAVLPPELQGVRQRYSL